MILFQYRNEGEEMSENGDYDINKLWCEAQQTPPLLPPTE